MNSTEASMDSQLSYAGEKLKRYIDCGVPTLSCNLRCHYCYITHNHLFDNKLSQFKYSADHIGKALSKERLGGTCLFNICASGETLVQPEIVGYTRALLEQGHYVMLVTNGMPSKRFDQISAFPKELLRRLFFKMSFHYLELKRLNGFDHFFANIAKIKAMGSSFTLEITPSDELIPHIDDIRSICGARVGAMPHVTVARDETKPDFPMLTSHSFEEYRKIWGVFDSSLFDYKMAVFGKKRNEFCYAGDWSFYLDIATGLFRQCNLSNFEQNIYDNIDRAIRFFPIGRSCKAGHCYNAHSFIGLGSIPELNSPSYAEMRNRVCPDGTEWLQPEVRHFFASKLSDSNRQYSSSEKQLIDLKNKTLMLKTVAIGNLKNNAKRLLGENGTGFLKRLLKKA